MNPPYFVPWNENVSLWGNPYDCTSKLDMFNFWVEYVTVVLLEIPGRPHQPPWLISLWVLGIIQVQNIHSRNLTRCIYVLFGVREAYNNPTFQYLEIVNQNFKCGFNGCAFRQTYREEIIFLMNLCQPCLYIPSLHNFHHVLYSYL